MGYQRPNKTLLDGAKSRAKEFVGRLPPGSRVSVVPACGSPGAALAGGPLAPRKTLPRRSTPCRWSIERTGRGRVRGGPGRLPPREQPAHETDRVPLRPAGGQLAARVAGPPDREARRPAPAREDRGVGRGERLDLGFPAPGRHCRRADALGLPRHGPLPGNGPSPGPTDVEHRRDAVAPQTVEVQPGQAKEVRFPSYRFSVPVQPGQATLVRAEVSIEPHDQLPGDDQRYLAVPVVAALPVVFVDQVGAGRGPDEELVRRDLPLAPSLGPGDEPRGAGQAACPGAAPQARPARPGPAPRRPAGRDGRARLSRRRSRRSRSCGSTWSKAGAWCWPPGATSTPRPGPRGLERRPGHPPRPLEAHAHRRRPEPRPRPGRCEAFQLDSGA